MIAIVTGAGAGIGAVVCVTWRQQEQIEAIAREIANPTLS
jgi:hypothetical protein